MGRKIHRMTACARRRKPVLRMDCRTRWVPWCAPQPCSGEGVLNPCAPAACCTHGSVDLISLLLTCTQDFELLFFEVLWQQWQLEQELQESARESLISSNRRHLLQACCPG